METTIERLKKISQRVSISSVEISRNNQTVAEGASRQAAGVQETSASLEELSAMTIQNAASAEEARKMAIEATRIVKQVDEHMKEKHMKEMEHAMANISESSRETGQIIKLINDIAFQTNLLSLNAAVEAARSGDAGRGFSVVANEVRNLPTRTASAAENTARLIDKTIKSIESGNQSTKTTMAVFRENIELSEKTKQIAEQILASSKEQASGIEQVSKAIAQIERVIQMNTAGADKSSVAANEMVGEAANMTVLVEELSTPCQWNGLMN